MLVLVFLILAAGLVSMGFLHFRQVERDYRTEMEHQLTAIADLKVDLLVQWRQERLGDGAIFHENPNFSRLVRHLIEHPDDAEAESRIRTWMVQVQAVYDYNRICLHDAAGKELVSISAAQGPCAADWTPGDREILTSGKVALADFSRTEQSKQVDLRLLVPILDNESGHAELGVLVLHIDPHIYLYPLITRWPVPAGRRKLCWCAARAIMWSF